MDVWEVEAAIKKKVEARELCDAFKTTES